MMFRFAFFLFFILFPRSRQGDYDYSRAIHDTTYGIVNLLQSRRYHLCYTKLAVGGVSHLGQNFPQPKVSSNLAFKLWMIRGTDVD
ncbi:hypothetical protein VN97_g10103 [Penicillium thymicola]|uniref:Secreted protein n=1 Tax=Penicillium thymicola TaxID=293382 RepID=A0AAI9T9M7_PENTH|nr:hypothetical protein VN97_g10103 [Penicillium thymicola]